MMRMAAVGASPLAAEDGLEPQWFVDMVASQRWTASLLNRTTGLLSMEKAGLEGKREMLRTLFIKYLHFLHVHFLLNCKFEHLWIHVSVVNRDTNFPW